MISARDHLTTFEENSKKHGTALIWRKGWQVGELSIAQLLKSEFQSRQNSNSRYSLRAFARDLEISQGYLSQLMNGEKFLSPDRAAIISKKMKWSVRESRLFVDLSRYAQARSWENRKLIEEDLKSLKKSRVSFRRLKADQFSVVSDWHHFAILELLEVTGFSSNPTWIAHRLRISVTEASLALDRLLALKLIEFGPGDELRKCHNNAVPEVSAAALRKFHLQQLKIAKNAIERLPFEERRASGITFAVDPERLNEAWEMIRDFRLKMAHHFHSGKKKRVYHLAVQLYPVDWVQQDVESSGTVGRSNRTVFFKSATKRPLD